jgi:hypothetical protein
MVSIAIWKYQARLQGYSGGALHHPTMRIQDPQMNLLRKGLADAGLSLETAPNHEFFTGRYPT